MSRTVAEELVETLAHADVQRICGVVGVEFALPYRQYLRKRSRTCAGYTAGSTPYRLPRRLQGRLALRLDTSLNLSQYNRPDLDIATYDFLRGTTVPALVFIRPYLEVSLQAVELCEKRPLSP
jgi:hypothetical protein